jgi:Zn-dependent peptidase ImmA (M78 family)
MNPLRPRYSKIDAVTTELLAKYGINSPPVPVNDIARSEGASIVVKQFNNEMSGLLLRNNNQAIIAVERYQPSTRRRFTVAHELGHLVLHQGKELRVDTKFRLNLRSPDSSTAEDVEEIESNSFAAALLMPEAFLRKDVQGLVLDIDDAEQINTLAKRYNVSAQAMTFRLVNLLSRGRL